MHSEENINKLEATNDSQNVEMIDTTTLGQQQPSHSIIKNYKAIQLKYEGYEQGLKQDKNSEYPRILSSITSEINEILTLSNTDYQHIFLLVNNFLPKYFKIILSRKYTGYEMPTQILVTKFINNWLRMRVPLLSQFFLQQIDSQPNEAKDPLIRCYGFQKEIDLLEMIFDDRNDIYNFNFSRNNQETEEDLYRIKEQMFNQEIDSRTSNTDIEISTHENTEVAFVLRSSSASYFYVHNVNIFQRYKGFDQIQAILKISNENSYQATLKKPTLKIVSQILSLLINIRYYLRENFWSVYAAELKDLVYFYIMNNCTSEDLRTLNKKETTYLIGSIENILDWNRSLKLEDKIDTVFQFSDQIELHIAKVCLQMPVLEKKIIAHNIISNKISKIRSAQLFQKNTNGNATNIHQRWINTERMVEWIQQSQIFDLIFGDSLHSEVIKKSVPLLEFMYDNNCMNEREFDKMWDCVTKKHEAYKVAILRALSIIIARANMKDISYIFKKVKSLQLSEVDKFTLNLVKSIAKRIAGEEVKRQNSVTQPQGGRNSGLGRSNSMTRDSKGKSRADDFRQKISQSRKSNENLSKYQDDGIIQSNKNLLANMGFPKDDMSTQINTQQNRKGKRTRSLSGGEDLNIKLDIQRNDLGMNLAQIEKDKTQIQSQNQRQNQNRLQQQDDIMEEVKRNTQDDNINPLDVPIDKEDKKTADEEGSFGDSQNPNEPNDFSDNLMEDIFDYQNASNNNNRQNQAINTNQIRVQQSELEEEKGDGAYSSRHEQIQLNIRLMITDSTLGIDDEDKRELAHQVLEYLWHLCLEETVLQNNLSFQTHKLSIDIFVEILSQNYHKAILPYISKSIQCLHHNFSVMSIQTLIQKLLTKIPIPIEQGKIFPKNRQELIQYIDEELSIANICLSSYIEFKRVSLSLILDQLGSQEQEQENLETQSSLDNEDEKSSMHSAHKNQPGQAQVQNQTNNMNIQDQSQQTPRDQLISIHDDQTNQSSGSLFISPRGKHEEEFKVPISYKTQSYQGDSIIQPNNYQRNNDFTALAQRDQDSGDDWFQKNNQNLALGTTGSHTVGNRHFNSQKKQNQNQQPRITDMTPGNQMQQNVRENNTQMIEQTQQNPPTQNNNRDFLNTLITNEVYSFSYYQDMHHRLDFLKFYFGQSPLILKPQQIQIVWECLVVNAFYEKERDQFFNWCTQILKQAQNLPGARDIENIGGASIFKDDCLEMLFFDTLLKLDFRFITETMYECFEKFMVYINEQYGQIMSNSAFESAFEVFETKLIGIEALWEITLCARNNKVYQKSAEFLHKLYKKMSPSLVEKLNEIKEDLLQTCMDQIKQGLHEIRSEVGQDLYEVPIYQLSETIEDPKNRIARSISQLCKFIDEFEGLRDRGARSSLASQDKEINLICNNSINGSIPKKINLTVPISTKIGYIREQIASLINPQKSSSQLCITFKGKDQNEDLKTLKELGVKIDDTHATFFVTMRNEYELEAEQFKDGRVDEIANDILNFGIEQPFDIIKLAVKKCGLNMDEAFLMLTEEDKVNDLQEELRKQEQAQNQILILEDKKDSSEKEDAKLNLIISNRTEYFDLLFDLLNLGINEITNASWNLLLQIPVNKQLLNSIRNLSIVQQGVSSNWSQIIDQSNVYKMLYSLQIVNSFISVNNEKLSESEIQERYEWRERFLEIGGFDHLYHILIGLDLDEIFFDQNTFQQQQRATGLGSKKKQRGAVNNKQKNDESNQDQKNKEQIQNNSAKCLGYLISIIKIFVQAALLTSDQENLLTLIVQSSTSPFRKPKTIQQIGPSKLNQMIFTNEKAGSVQDLSMNDISRGNSSANTPKFHSNHSSNIMTPECNTPNDQANDKANQNKSMETQSQQTLYKADQQSDQLYTQVDDFPRLVDQMNGGIAKNLLEKVISFNALLSKLLYIIQKSTQICDSKEVSSLVQNCLDLLLPCVVWQPNLLLKEIYEFEHLESLLINTLMFSQNENVRKSLERTFKIICSDRIVKSKQQTSSNLDDNSQNNQQLSIESPKIYILKILLKNMPEINQKSDQCEEYFNLLTHLIKQCNSNFQLIPKQNMLAQSYTVSKQRIIIDDNTFSSIDLLEWSIAQLKNRPTYEDKYSNYTDKILGGYLQLTQSVLEIDQQLKFLTVNDQGLFNLVKTVFDFLFLLPSVEEQQRKHQQNDVISANDYPKCKRKFTRKKAFNLLLTLCHQCKPNYIQLLEELYKFHASIKTTEKVVNMQDIDLDQSARSATGYVGLMNFAATCYMNSLIQQLFMIPDLRQGVLRASINTENLEQNVLYQLKQTFANLQESEKQYYAPQGFTQAFKFYGEPVNVRVQQDTHEFYNILCEDIEESLKGTPAQNLLKETVGGVIGNETKSLESEFPYTGEREENFFAISLDIKNKKNLAEALDLYIKPDFLEGDNKYLCEKYNTKINAQRRSYLKKLSNTVIINLKRFDFDFNTMQRQKLNEYCEFPTKINFKPWTKEGIKQREKELARGQRNENGIENGSNQNNQNEDFLEDQQKVQSQQNDEILGGVQNAAGDDIDQDEMNSVDDQESLSQRSEADIEEKKGGEALDEDMESPDEDIDQNVNTGTYFDEDIIDIAVDDDESQSIDLTQNEKQGSIKPGKKQKKAQSVQAKNSSQKRTSRKRLQSKDDTYYEYELVGVLVHSGGAEGGHYYSYIKERNGSRRWLKFDDKNVSAFDEAKLGAECFGGQGGGNTYSGFMDDFGTGGGGLFQRSANAYLLFYQRANSCLESFEDTNKLQSQQQVQQRFINNIEESIYQKIWQENAAFLKLKVFFDQEYFAFIREYVGIYNFENVLYFSKENSLSYKIKQMKALTLKYQEDIEKGQISENYREIFRDIEKNFKSGQDSNIFYEIDKIREDPGLNTLKLATVLSYDIITKAKDVQSFVSLMQLISTLLERHEIACVWFIKYISENRGMLEQLLLESQMFEVRDSFSTLLKSALSVTAKNEELYFNEFEEYLNFDCEQEKILTKKVEIIYEPKASTIRLMKLLFIDMLDQVRVHWRRFEEYFFVLIHFTQTGFEEAKFMIESRAIYKLIEFIANSQIPFTSNKFKMGDRGQDPDFKHVYDFISYLVRCCFTQGISNISEYSPISIFQKEEQHLFMIPEERKSLVSGHFFNTRVLCKSTQINKAMVEIVQHLSWGDFEASKLFINEIYDQLHISGKYSTVESNQNMFENISRLLTIRDSIQERRLTEWFQFEVLNSPKQKIFDFLKQIRLDNSRLVLYMIKLFGNLSLQDPVIMKYLQNYSQQFQDWIIDFLTFDPKNVRITNQDEFLNKRQQDIGEIQTAVNLSQSDPFFQYSEIFMNPTILDFSNQNRQGQGDISSQKPQIIAQIHNDSFEFVTQSNQQDDNFDFGDNPNHMDNLVMEEIIFAQQNQDQNLVPPNEEKNPNDPDDGIPEFNDDELNQAFTEHWQ